MRLVSAVLLGLLALGAAGCDDDNTAPRDVTPPAAPRGVRSITGDGRVYLSWLGNTEPDLMAYAVYVADCATGSSCPYTRVGTTSGTTYTVNALVNGSTRYFAVAAIDRAGNESDLSYDTVFDTPRPEGFGASIANDVQTTDGAGWDFSAARAISSTNAAADMYFGYNGSVYQMFVPDFSTDIQDAGYATSLDAVDYSPDAGWSPTGSVELIPGHCYVVWTRDNHYAKFRVTGLSASAVTFDWAYQVDTGNRELRAVRPIAEGEPVARPKLWIR